MREKIVDAIHGVKILALVIAVSAFVTYWTTRSAEAFQMNLVIGLASAVVSLEMFFRKAKREVKSGEQGPILRR